MVGTTLKQVIVDNIMLEPMEFMEPYVSGPNTLFGYSTNDFFKVDLVIISMKDLAAS